MIENLSCVLTYDYNAYDGILFPPEDEIMEIVQVNVLIEDNDDRIDDKVEDDLCLEPNQPVAVVWDDKSTNKW